MAFLTSNSFKVQLVSSPSPKVAENSGQGKEGNEVHTEKNVEGNYGDDQVGDYAKSPKNGHVHESGSRIEQLPLWNKGVEVLEASKEYAADIGRSLFQMKERLMDKLAAVPVPAEALDNARHSIESMFKEMTHAAQGITKDAVYRIKARLVEILPSLSPTQTEKIVDDAEMEVLDIPQGAAAGDKGKPSLAEADKQETQRDEGGPSKSWFISPASSFSINMGRLKRPFSPRSRL